MTARLDSPSGASDGAAARRFDLAALGLLATLGVLWGSAYAFAAIALQSIPPVTLVAIRVAGAALVLTAVVAWRAMAIPRDAATWRRLLLQGTINPLAPWVLIAWGQQFVGSALTGVINTLSPALTVLIIVLWTRHEPVTRTKIAGVALGFVGVVTIIGPSAITGAREDFLAEFAILVGTLCFAVSSVIGRRFDGMPATVVAWGTLVCASVVLVPASLALDQPWTLRPTAAGMAAALVLSLACTALAFLIYFRLLRTIGSAGTTSLSYIRVGVAVLLGTVALGEPISLKLALGLAFVVAAVVLIARRSA